VTLTPDAPVTDRPKVDLLDPAFYLEDSHAAYTWMRAHEPVYRDEGNGLWAVTRHADVHDVESRSDVFVSSLGYRSFHSPGETNMIAQDDPRHHEQRALVARRFTPKAVRTHEAWITDTVAALIDGFAPADAPGGAVEVVDALAAQLPCRLTARLLGWDEDRWPAIKGWSERLMRYDAIARDPEAAMGMMTAIMEFNADLTDMVAARRGCPVDSGSDLVAVWANAAIDGAALDAETIMHETGLFISGGAETTRTVISRGLRTFCDHNDQWELLAADPSLVPAAVEELIRWVTPLNNFFRTAVTDTTVDEQPIAAGDRLILLYPSANRDDAVFADPDRFDVTRSPNPHLGFGFGTHFCLGASLARFELGLLFTALTQRITNLRVEVETDDEPNMFASGVRSFTLGFDWR
jgi:cytochrome P450 family 142 subfamily A polypeptide 1